MPTTLRVPMDPDDIDDLTWPWALRLATGETIASATVTVDAGAVVTSTIDGTDVIARINAAGGTSAVSGSYINALCRIVTSTGRQLDWTIRVPVEVQ